jgi:Ribonuclease G/E
MSVIVVEDGMIAMRAARLVDGRMDAASYAPQPISDIHGRLAPLPGDVFLGRVKRTAGELGGYFVDLGVGEQALLPKEGKDSALTEGASVIVAVTRPAQGGKGPRLSRHIDLGARWPDFASLATFAKTQTAPCPLAQALPLARVISDCWADDVDAIKCAPSLVEAVRALNLGCVIDVWTDPMPLFAALELDAQIEACLNPRVDLAGGAWLMIEPTAALVAIDVNSGSDHRPRAMINAAAADEIARQIRLRDLGGRIAVDFIAARDGADLPGAVARLTRALADPDGRVQVIGPSRLGLVEIERRRRNRGIYGDLRYYADQAIRQLIQTALGRPDRTVTLTAGQALFDWFSARPAIFAELERQLGRKPALIMNTALTQTGYTIEDRAP